MEGAGTAPKSAAPKGAAFFDLDDTLLDVNSGVLLHASDGGRLTLPL